MTEYLPVHSLLRLLVVFAVVVAPHATRLPVWISIGVAAACIWRALASVRQWNMPGRAFKFGLIVLAILGVWLSFGRITGQEAGVALLTVMLGLKLTESRSRRDVMVLVMLMYFAVVTPFLFSQELWTVIYLIVAFLGVTACLIDANHPASGLPTRWLVRRAALMAAQALPIMAVLFVLFPRIEGQLWGLPTDSGASASSGLAEDMAPGEIASLALSSEVAFRAEFHGATPDRSQMYWRGPVLRFFNGHQWTAGYRPAALRDTPALVNQAGDARYRYTLTLEPTRQHWVLALDMADPTALPPDTRLTPEFQVYARDPLNERKRFEMQSLVNYQAQPELDDNWRSVNLQWPADADPRTRALGQQWRQQAGTGTGADRAIAEMAMAYIHDQPFYYTLNPPTLPGNNSVDRFLFDVRRGFCEHYASAFTLLMRAAGIPARVVLGYQGGDLNPFGGHWVIRQSDAHAWSEVWLPSQGWTRFDPTSAILASRIEANVVEANPLTDGVDRRLNAGFLLKALYRSEAAWEWVNAGWNGFFLGYGPELQQKFLSHFGLVDWHSMGIALGLCITLLLVILGGYLSWRSRPIRDADPALRAWNQIRDRLTKRGYGPRPGEGPRDYVHRLCEEDPQLKPALKPALSAYLSWRYANDASPEHLDTLRRSLRQLRRFHA